MATKKRLLSPTGLDGNSLTLTNVATPSASSDASTKGYVDTLVPSQTGNTGKYLTTNGTATSWGTIAGGGSVTSITAGTGLSGGVITTSGTIAIDSTVTTLTGAQTLTNKTLTSPTLTTPVLGTPASGTLTNCTFPTLNQNTTGSAGSVANTLTITSPLSGTSYNGSSAVSIGIPVATTSTNGYLSSTDWTTFNNKTSNTGTVTSVSGTGNVSGITLSGTVTGSGSLTLGGSIGTLNQNTTGYAGYLNTTNQGLTGSTGLTTVSSTTAWSNYPIGYSAMFNAGQTATGAPSSSYGFFIKIANRDAGGGWGGIWTDYSGGDTYVGNTTVSSSYATWYKLLSSANYSSYALPITGGTLTGQLRLFYGSSPELLFRNGAYPSIYGGRLQMLDYGDGMGINFDTSNNVDTFGTRMVIRHNGRVGIANTNPQYTLDVTGQVRATDRIHSNEWIQFSNATGLYSPTNSAHFLPNHSSYGSWKVVGSRNGWCGLEFETSSNGNVSLMIAQNGGTSGFHNNSVGWQMRWNAGTIYCNKGSHGAGTEATVLDSTNYSSYAFPLAGGGLNGDLNLGANYLRFDQSGTRSWNMRATGGNLDIASGDGNGDLRYQGQRIPKTFVQSGTPSGTIVNGDVWLQHA